jgi:gamma-glutamyl:cysteine ligase YbdK (ATP-grasp superfamily)
MPFDRGDRTYYLSDERLRTFRALPAEAKLRWVEELATFLRLARSDRETEVGKDKKPNQPL